MTRLLIFIACMATAIALTTQPRAQTYDKIVYGRMRALVPNLISEVNRLLEPEDTVKLDELYLRIDPRTLTNASAGEDRSTGRPQITIYTGLVLAIDMIAQALVVYAEYPGCAQGYLSLLYEEYQKDTERALSGLPVRQMPTPPAYYSKEPGCRDARDLILNLPPDLGQVYRLSVEASITLLFLHELAHIQLEHSANVGREQSRLQEAAADEWALRRLPRFYPAGYALPLMTHIAVTNGASLEDERKMSHPLGAKRLIRLLDDVIPTIDDDDIIEQLEFLKARLEEIIQ